MSDKCQKCKSNRVAFATAEATRLKYVRVGDQEVDSIPDGMGITSGENFIRMSWCLDCGQIQGKWPARRSPLEPYALPKVTLPTK